MTKRLLFVEDQPEFSDLIIKLREEVDSIFCGELELVVLRELGMAKHVLDTNNVGLVILDLSLPDSRQSETVEWIAEVHHKFPIFVLTGDERFDLRKQCLFAGAAGFAIKRHAIQSPHFFFAELFNARLQFLIAHGNHATA